MNTILSTIRTAVLLTTLFFSVSCDQKADISRITLVGSTPGDELIKAMLDIPAHTKIDFMNWDLLLDSKNSFVLNLVYGESQPNTLGFIMGGEKRTIKGTFAVSKDSENKCFQEIYQLESVSLPEKISLVKLTENLFHLLTPQNQLMVGTAGWSYSLNRKEKALSNKILISSECNDQSPQVVYEGRTPCKEIAAEHPEMKATQYCFKLKWQLILYRDSLTLQPTTCFIRNIVNNGPRNTIGKWQIVKGTDDNPDIEIYKIEVENLAEPHFLLAGDDNVLFFLDKNMNPIIGNENFSFTLNRKIEAE